MGTALDYNFLYQYEQRNPNMCWNLINSLPPPHRGPEEEQQQRKRVEAELHHQQREAAAAAAHQQQREAAAAAAHQQQAVAAVRQQQLIAASRAMSERERAAYYPPPSAQVQRPPSVPSKVDYGPPPAAHSRVSQGGKGVGQGEKPQLPKAEPPNFNLFGYHPSYQSPLAFLPQHQQADSKHMKQDHKPTQLIVTKSSSIDNPPPLLSDMKNSVIVKNEGKSPQSMDSVKPLMAHSPSPKPQGHYLATPVSSSPSSAAQMKYEYRSPSQSPHHLSHPHTPSPHPYEMNKVVGHHPRQARQSPHPPPHRQSPHPPPASQPPHHRQSPHQHQPHPPPPPSHRQSPHHPHPHPSPPSTVVYTSKPSATVLSYPYPAPGPPGIQHYAPPPASPALLKPKVSSPAPPHIYGKPGIASGTPPVVRTQDVTLSPLPLPAKPPLATSPYQQLSQHNPPPPHQVHPSAGLPPPPAAHSARVMYDQRGGATTVYPVAVSVKAPAASPPDHPHLALTPAVQTQPLDLGVSSSSVRLGSPGGGLSLSPKRKVCDEPEALDIKKRRSETPTSAPSDTISANASCVSEPVLSRVSEPSPLLANAATTITTVVNVAAAAAAATESVDNVGKPGTPAPCPSPAKPGSGVDSEKSNSPGPPRPVHKLKKAWLQRHSGEDVTSCVAPPSSPPASRKESPVISSLHSIGSMAVNSISKSSKPAKGARKGKDDASLHNGHLTPVKTTDADDSSSSDLERKTTPVKRVPPKVKRKKGGRSKAVAPASKKPQQTAVSASSTDSDKESGSEKDSDGKKTSAASNDKPAKDSASANGRKRGRRPKSSNNSSPNQTKNEGGEEPRGKKPREDPPAPPFQKQPTVAQLKKSGDSFLQDGPCFEVAPKLAKCRECRWTPNQRSRNMPNIFCRFYAFRRLRYTKNGQLAIAGFSDPHRDASHDDLKLWLPPPPDNPSPVPDLDMSRFLLSQLGDPFCHIIQQENEALSVHMSEDKVIAWKRVVQGVREMCDVCETTLFNYHWACSKCGFVVCIDCYKGRKNGTVKEWNDGSGVSGGSGVGGGGGGGGGRDRDEVSWLLCTNRQPHEQDKLMLTQIVAGDSLQIVSRKAHEACLHLGISMNCACPHAQRLQAHVKPTNGINKDLLKNLRTKAEPVNGQIKQEKPEKDEESVEDNGGDNKKTDPLNWLADLALSSEDKKHGDTGSSDSDTEDGNHSTLRELLIRAPSTKGGHATPEENSSSSSPAPAPAAAASENGTTLPNSNVNANAKDELTWKKKKEISNETDSKAEVKTEKLVHYVSRYTGASKGGSMSLPLRIMTLSESSLFYPDVPHLWLCDGKLLRLLDADNPDNYSIFQDQWKRGQPVMVSDVTKNMDMSLWHPDAFAKDFGDDKNHLVNCLTGKIVPNQPMRKFWEGFDSLAKRLKDEKGQPMVLKLKDWPPTEDFAEMLPTRFNDLMKVLPLKEYTTRGGRLNLASRLPECFVRPDLGPKMYTAYGSAGQHKGTTNLHLDISDAVNVMIYVSIPEDACEEDYNKEALRAIDEASCDILTRRRVREAGILPGAIWHIYLPRDADKIRDFLNKVALERGARLEPHHDPIHDQTWYIDTELQVRLYQEYNVQGFSIVQCQGDAVFIPAGAPHQVKNLHNCIKVAEDFVSPENVSHCFHLTQEFRELSDTHSNHEDKLQIKNIMYHAVKDSLGVLSTLKTEPSANDAKAQPQPQVTDES